MKSRSFEHNGVEYKYDPRDKRLVRTHWIFSYTMAYQRALKVGMVRRIEVAKHQKEHEIECRKFEGKNWSRLHPHYAPVSNMVREPSLDVDGESYRIDTYYILIPTRCQRLKRFVSRDRWT